MHTTLISATDLAPHTANPNWLIVDCRFDLAKPQSGEQAYREGHIPGAVYAHLDRDLSSPITKESGRHPLPDPERFARRLGEWGVSTTLTPARTRRVCGGSSDGSVTKPSQCSTGGLRAWKEAGLPLTTEIAQRTPTRFIARPNRSAWLSTGEVAEKIRAGWRLLDARAPERFVGKVEPIDPIAGHVPGAINHPLASNLNAEGRFLSAEDLRARYTRSQAGVEDDRTIAMCGSGVTACHLLLGMEIAGKRGARLYAGSWSEWIRDPDRPKAMGDDG